MSPTVHMIVGSVTLVLFLLNGGMYAVEFFRGAAVPRHRLVSFSAATALLLQYALGFMLLGAGHSVRWTHIVFALLAVLPLGIEHGMAPKRTSLRMQALFGLLASVLTIALVFTAYWIGQTN